MVHLFNRKELLVTWSMTELAEIRDILASEGIEYRVKTQSLARSFPGSPGTRARTGSFGLREDAMYQYSVFVKKTDYETARHRIGR